MYNVQDPVILVFQFPGGKGLIESNLSMKTFKELSIVFIVSFCFRQAEPSVVHQKIIGQEDKIIDGATDFSCHDSFGRPYIKDIPHPNNCNYFLKCEERFGGNPVPLTHPCPPNLHFSILSCRCEHSFNALCFDYTNPEHEPMRMNCACPLIPGPGGTLVPDMSDKRCHNSY